MTHRNSLSLNGSTDYTTHSTPDPKTESKNITKEHEQTVTIKSSREWFIRRKHKGPYFENRVKKLSATLRSPEFKLVNKQRRFNISETTPDLKDFPVRRVAKKSDVKSNSLNKSDVIRNVLKARVTDISQLRNPKNSSKRGSNLDKQRKRPITMGIPASSTVLLTPTPPPSPSPATAAGVEGPQDSDEYYSSYGEYPDIPPMGYNNTGIYD